MFHTGTVYINSFRCRIHRQKLCSPLATIVSINCHKLICEQCTHTADMFMYTRVRKKQTKQLLFIQIDIEELNLMCAQWKKETEREHFCCVYAFTRKTWSKTCYRHYKISYKCVYDACMRCSNVLFLRIITILTFILCRLVAMPCHAMPMSMILSLS